MIKTPKWFVQIHIAPLEGNTAVSLDKHASPNKSVFQ